MDDDVGEPGSGAVETSPLRLFLSHRRSDDVNFIGRFHDRLIEAFGEERLP